MKIEQLGEETVELKVHLRAVQEDVREVKQLMEKMKSSFDELFSKIMESHSKEEQAHSLLLLQTEPFQDKILESFHRSVQYETKSLWTELDAKTFPQCYGEAIHVRQQKI